MCGMSHSDFAFLLLFSGAKFKLDKLRVHLKYFCGESAQKTEAQARQRRTADRNRNGGQRGSGQSSSSKKNMSKTKPPMTNVSRKKTVRLSGNDEYDSDSDLSLPDEKVVSGSRKRPSRAGANQTKRKIAKCMKGEDDDYDSDGSCYGTNDEDNSSDDSVSSEDVKIVKLRKTPTKPKGKKGSTNNAAEAAREKQRQALEAASNKKGKKAPTKTNGKKKKFDQDSDSDSGNGDAVDPLAGIDMDDLMKEAMAGARFSILHAFSWWRVVLDEAHFIKSRSSQTAAAAFSLSSIHRWCLSGTPLQNRVGELYSLIRFLRIDPMAYYFCRQKGCSCKSIHYRFKDGRCQDCGHRPFSHFAHFNKVSLVCSISVQFPSVPQFHRCLTIEFSVLTLSSTYSMRFSAMGIQETGDGRCSR